MSDLLTLGCSGKEHANGRSQFHLLPYAMHIYKPHLLTLMVQLHRFCVTTKSKAEVVKV